MRYFKKFRHVGPVVLSSLGLMGLVSLGIVLSLSFDGHAVERVFAQTTNVNTPKKPKYKLWKVFATSGSVKAAIAVITVDSKILNDEGMASIATQLNQDFEIFDELKVGILTDVITAELFTSGKVNYATYESAEVGRYMLDRQESKEYIEFLLIDSTWRRLDLDGFGNLIAREP